MKNNKVFIAIFLYFFSCHFAFSAEKIVSIPDVKNKAARSQSTSFQRKEIEKSPAVTLSDLFKHQQSMVRLTNNSGDSSQTALSIRGFGDNAVANTLILVDGFPLTNPSLLAPNFNSIPLTDIERVDIFQGSEGTLWGDQAVGGVVNIITKHPKKLFSNAIISLGSYNNHYYNFMIGDKFQNGIFFKAFGLTGNTQHYRHHNQETGNNIAAQAGMDYSRGTFLINAQSYSDTTDFPGGLSLEQFQQNPRQATNYHNFSHYTTHLVQLLNKQALNNNWLLETRLAHHETDGNGFIYLNFTRRDSLTSFNPRLTGHIFKNKITMGYDGQISHFQLLNTKVQSRTTAKQNDLYLQTVFPLSGKIDFTLGTRAAWQANAIETVMGQPKKSSNKIWVTEQGITYHPVSTVSLYLRRDGNFSFPKANEEIWVSSNTSGLRAQTGVSYETGAEWNTDKLKSQLNFYRLALNDEIAFNPTQTVSQPFGAYNNLDKTLRHGVTLSEAYYLNDKTTLKSQLNYVNAKFASGIYSGKTIPAVPAITGNAEMDYDWAENWQTQYTLLYSGNRQASEDLSNSGKKVNGYWLNNIALQYTINPIILSFEVMNIFNQLYSSYVYYNPDNQTNTYYPAPGRNYLLSLKANLD